MKMNRDYALQMWDAVFGSKSLAIDFAGRYIYRDDFNDKVQLRIDNAGHQYNFGWNIHHILPISLGGTNETRNLLIVHWMTNSEASDKNTFSINSISYQVRKIKFTSSYGIFQTKTGERVDYWKDLE